jgi:penicillin amidase
MQFENKDINTALGVLHKIKFIHPLGSVEELDKSFNIGPFDIGGDQTTPNNTEFQFNNVLEEGNYSTLVGASMRIIINMADIEHSYTINSTGQSGQPVHPNYRDQSRKWLYGEYKANTMNRFEMISQNYSLLILFPSY